MADDQPQPSPADLRVASDYLEERGFGAVAAWMRGQADAMENGPIDLDPRGVAAMIGGARPYRPNVPWSDAARSSPLADIRHAAMLVREATAARVNSEWSALMGIGTAARVVVNTNSYDLHGRRMIEGTGGRRGGSPTGPALLEDINRILTANSLPNVRLAYGVPEGRVLVVGPRMLAACRSNPGEGPIGVEPAAVMDVEAEYPTADLTPWFQLSDAEIEAMGYPAPINMTPYAEMSRRRLIRITHRDPGESSPPSAP